MLTTMDGREVVCPVCHEPDCDGCDIDPAELGWYVTGSYDERVENGMQTLIQRTIKTEEEAEDALASFC